MLRPASMAWRGVLLGCCALSAPAAERVEPPAGPAPGRAELHVGATIPRITVSGTLTRTADGDGWRIDVVLPAYADGVTVPHEALRLNGAAVVPLGTSDRAPSHGRLTLRFARAALPPDTSLQLTGVIGGGHLLLADEAGPAAAEAAPARPPAAGPTAAAPPRRPRPVRVLRRAQPADAAAALEVQAVWTTDAAAPRRRADSGEIAR